MTTADLNPTEFNPYYEQYIRKLQDHLQLREGFEAGKANVIRFFEAIPEEKANYRYAPGKWSIKEILQHLIDTERVFMYRCFRIARNDRTALPGFDQDTYIEPSGAAAKTMAALLNEYKAVRQSFISLLGSLSDAHLQYTGTASGGAMSARAAAFIILGHEIWHTEIIKERYL